MIETENLTKRYGDHVAVDSLNLQVRPGEIYGFLGPNGAGKTTTIHMLLNLVQPTSGRICLFGKPLERGSFAFRQQLGVVAEEPVELSRLTGWELVRYFSRLGGVDAPESRMEELFHALELWDARDALARDYSRGMRQKLSLIRALVHGPRLLILDEPVSGLDPHGIRQVRELIHAYRDQGGTVFISSHILSEIERSADRIGILHQGSLLIEDTLAGLRRRLGSGRRLVVELERLAAPLVERLGQEPYVLELHVTDSGRQLELLLEDGDDVRPRLSHLITELGGVILRMESEEMSLEDAFVTFTNQNVSRLAGEGGGGVAFGSGGKGGALRSRGEEGTDDQIPRTPLPLPPSGRLRPPPSAQRPPQRSAPLTPLRWRAIDQISRQEVRDAVYGWSLYLAAAVVVLVGTVLVYNTLRSVAESGLEIVSRPFYSALLIATSVAAVYHAGWAALAIARPRDQGALRVLFFAPVDPLGLIGAHLVAALAIYVIFVLLTTPLFALLAALTNLPLPATLVAGVLVSPVFVAPAVGIGLFISAIASSGRSAVFLFAAALAVVLAVQIGYSALLQIPPTSRYYDALLFLRELLRVTRDALQWVSPLALLSQGLDAANRASWRELLLYVGSGLAGAAIWLVLAVWALGRRGILP